MDYLYRSSTEELARRYKHLFKLPSLPILIVLFILSSTALITLLVRAENLSLLVGTLALSASLLSTFVIVTIIQLLDKNSIISIRRTSALLIISTLIWLFAFAVGVGYAMVFKNALAKVDTFIFGGFLAIGFELVVINGIFLKSTLRSLGLALIHPFSLYSILLPKVASDSFDYTISSTAGLVILATAIIFLRKLKTFKTKHGITSLQLLQAFLKTWISRHPQELESYFELYSKNENVETKVLHFVVNGKKLNLILPGIHPGPFYPVGSYNLSGMIYQTLKNNDSIPMVLHGTGGHERNLPRSEYTRQYAAKLADFIASLTAEESDGMSGPFRTKIGITDVTTMAFGKEILTIMSNSPYNSDDLDPTSVANAVSTAKEHGIDLALVDAHNSISGENPPSTQIKKEDWISLFKKLEADKGREFELGYAHSSEINFPHGSDISDAGIGVLTFESDQSRSTIVVADSNNARTGLREQLRDELNTIGINLIDLCTSDTHNLAARSLIRRGYFALGEATQKNEIIKAIKTLITIAQRRSGACKYTVANFSMNVPLIGNESLNDFASLTNKAIKFTKSYCKKALPLAFALLAITLFY